MKVASKILLLFLVCFTSLFSQTREKIHIEQKGSRILIFVNDLYTNCASKYSSDIDIQDNNIYVSFFDISNQKARCNCYIDLTIQLNQIPSGEYKLFVQKREFKKFGYARDTTTNLFTQNIKVRSNNTRIMASNSIEQSDCKKSQERTKNEPETNKEVIVNTNLSASTITLLFDLPDDADINVQLFNMLGKQIFSAYKNGLSRGTNSVTFSVKDLNTGIYIGRITTNSGQTYNFRLNWSK